MSSNSRETRLRQKAEAESAVEARVAELEAAGFDDKKMARDPMLRKVKAIVKKANVRLKAIDAKHALTEALAQKKAIPKDQPKAKGNAKAAKEQTKAKAKAKKSK